MNRWAIFVRPLRGLINCHPDRTPSPHHLLLTAYCLLPTAFCLLPTAYCLLLFAVPIASELLPSPFRWACHSAGHCCQPGRSSARHSTDRAPREFPTTDPWAAEQDS